uniref:Uncharacterized protein n=1 Tax=Anguilla anguilla TaxID=7936 RepID=A0A0E9SK32_ANGAN
MLCRFLFSHTTYNRHHIYFFASINPAQPNSIHVSSSVLL